MDTSPLSKKPKVLLVLYSLAILFLVWRGALLTTPHGDLFDKLSFYWAALYQLVALFGAIAGFIAARYWGGWSSVLGRLMLVFSFGLLFQSIGQGISTYYVYTTGDLPYPSFGDVGFFGSVLFYIYGVFLLAKVAGVKVSLGSYVNKFQAVIVPLIIIAGSYGLFLNGYEFDWSSPVKTFLDFGYPIGQAFYLSVTILVLLLSRKVLGGIMKVPVIYFLISLLAQYFSDFTFLYQSNAGTYVGGGIVDFMYFVSYFAMAFSLIELGLVFDKIRES